MRTALLAVSALALAACAGQPAPVSSTATASASAGEPEFRALYKELIEINTTSHAESSEVSDLPVDVATRLAEDLAHRAHDLRDDAT